MAHWTCHSHACLAAFAYLHRRLSPVRELLCARCLAICLLLHSCALLAFADWLCALCCAACALAAYVARLIAASAYALMCGYACAILLWSARLSLAWLCMLACRPDQAACVGISVSCAWPSLALLAACFCASAVMVFAACDCAIWPMAVCLSFAHMSITIYVACSCAIWIMYDYPAACFCLFAENIRIYQTIYRWSICLHAIKCLPLIIQTHSIMEVNYAR